MGKKMWGYSFKQTDRLVKKNYTLNSEKIGESEK